MRYQGKLNDWRDDKGFGFVTPNGGGQRAFVHIKSFSNRQRRPVGDEFVTYEVAYDAMGRAQAENIVFVNERPLRSQANTRSSAPLFVAALFFLFMIGAIALGKMRSTIPAIYIAASVITFIVYNKDKTAAKKNPRGRTPETTLHMLALACGWPGALMAQYMLRHKSKKASFQSTFWATVVLNFGGLCWLLWAEGATALRSAIGLYFAVHAAT